MVLLCGPSKWSHSDGRHASSRVRKLVRAIGRASRSQSAGADRLKPGYQELLAVAEDLLARARRLLAELAFVVPQPALRVDA